MTQAVALAQQASTGVSQGFKNRIINGAMVIDQRNAGASVTPDNTYTLDRWFYGSTQNSKVTIQQNAGSVTPPVGFSNYLGVTSSSAYSITSSDIFYVRQPIEGFNTADLMFGTANAKTVTLSFWVYSSLTGTFGGSLRNSASSRSYPYSYTISSANTWEYKTITIPGDTTGTWVGATNGIGMLVHFALGVGSTYSGTAGAWAGANYLSATGATSVVGTNGATFYITGVQLEVGSTATSFDTRSIGTELQLCQRYYYKHASGSGFSIGVGSQYNASNGSVPVFFKQPMRTIPTLSVTSGSNYYIGYYNGTNATSSAPDLNASSTEMVGLLATNTGATAGNALDFRTNNASSFVAFQAEL